MKFLLRCEWREGKEREREREETDLGKEWI